MAKITPTSEQLDIINTETDVLVIEAGAGASKTTTLAMFAESRPRERMLYVAYNAAIRDEARLKFPSNVKVMTSHGIAYGVVGKGYSHKLGNINSSVYRNEIKLSQYLDGPKDMRLFMQVVNDALASFLSDTSSAPSIDHVKIDRKIIVLQSLKASTVLHILKDIWKRMQDTDDAKVPMTHDGYLKLFMINGHGVGRYDRILFDESQDANPVTLELIQRSPGKKVFVGDRNQSIYKFRGAVDAMRRIPASQRKLLSGSFRFGSNIALAANRILSMKGSLNLIRGISGQEDEVILPASEEDYGNVAKEILGTQGCGNIAMLAFNNQTVMDLAIMAADANRRAFFVGGIENYRMSNLMDVYALKFGGKVEDPLVAAFSSFEELKTYAETDMEISQRIKMVEKHKEKLPELLARIQRIAVKNLHEAEVVISTVHKAKGLEFDTVILASDMQAFGLDYYFEHKGEAGENVMGNALAYKVETGQAFRKTIKDDEDPNLCYVAITRAKRRLVLPPNAIHLYMSQRITASLLARIASEKIMGEGVKAYDDAVNDAATSIPQNINGSITTQEHRELRRNRHL